MWSTPTRYAFEALAVLKTISISSSDNLYGSAIAPLCTFDLNSPDFLTRFVQANILLSTTNVLTSESVGIYSCINNSASCLNRACTTDTKES